MQMVCWSGIGWSGIDGIHGRTRLCAGLWNFMIVRVKERTAVELERERNRATGAAIQLLPRDCELLEYEPEGRLRVIRRVGLATIPPTTVGERLPGAGDELNR
jgi:hypothetical protein